MQQLIFFKWIKIHFLIFIICAASCRKSEAGYQKTEMKDAEAPTSEPSMRGESMQDSTVASPILPELLMGSTVSRMTALDSTKKLLRKADLKFKVENVYDASLQTEKIVREQNGFVQSSKIDNQIYNTEQVSISQDTFVKITTYVIENNMILRVPAQNLDSLLIKIGKMMTFLNYRHIEVRDITLDFLTQELAQKRNSKLQKRLQAQSDKKTQAKLEENVLAETQASLAEEKADEAKIEQYRMADSLKYSFVKLSVYQNENRWAEKLPNPRSFDLYKPSWLSRIWSAIVHGFEGLMEFFIALLSIWPVFLIISVVAYFYFKYLR